jgi:predicted hydrocarbon binding protein
VRDARTHQGNVFPNKISRILLRAVQDVIGENGSQAVFTTARLTELIDDLPPADFEPGLTYAEVGRLFEAIESIYGVSGGRQLARQAGQTSFRYWIEGFGSIVGLADVIFRVLPLKMRVKIGIEVVAEIFNRYSGQRVVLGEGSDSYFFVLERCGFCEGRRADAPICAFPVGLLEETIFWVSRGNRFSVEETSCIACGDPVCTICVGKELQEQPA